jgi:A/G-specific adenine glycosylase
MLQQTQAKTVIAYYDRFLEKFPDVGSLAQASEQEILALWSGLGYYGRARNLHRAARQIAETYGSFPESFDAIRVLPGIGRYTAGAICSIACNQPYPVVDGNIRRVVTRLKEINGHAPESYFWNQMSAWLPEEKASSFNQAMMELGALICVPFHPRCPQCPVKRFCEARKSGIQNSIPRARVKRAPKHRRIVTLVLERKGRILLTSLIKPDFVPGPWVLPCRIAANRESIKEVASLLCRNVLGRTLPLAPCVQIRHAISNYRIAVYGFWGEAIFPGQRWQRTAGFRWTPYAALKTFLTSSLFHKVLQGYEDLHP